MLFAWPSKPPFGLMHQDAYHWQRKTLALLPVISSNDPVEGGLPDAQRLSTGGNTVSIVS